MILRSKHQLGDVRRYFAREWSGSNCPRIIGAIDKRLGPRKLKRAFPRRVVQLLVECSNIPCSVSQGDVLGAEMEPEDASARPEGHHVATEPV